jgi:hypothetical protein
MSQRLAPKVGIASCLALVVALAFPYFVAPGTAVAVYYDTTAVPVELLDVLFALVAVVAFGSGLNERTDPPTVAGATLALGGVVAILTLWWATATTAATTDALVQAARMDELAYHRWVVLLAALAIPASAGWYARTVL